MSVTKVKRTQGTRAGEEVRTETPWSMMLHNYWHKQINQVVWRLWSTLRHDLEEGDQSHVGGAREGPGGGGAVS